MEFIILRTKRNTGKIFRWRVCPTRYFLRQGAWCITHTRLIVHFHLGQHRAFVDANEDSLIVVRFFAQWCKTCRAMEPKFRSIVRDPKYSKNMSNTNRSILFADFNVTPINQDYSLSLGVENVPTVQVIVPGGLVENFACPPSKIHKLKRRLFLYRDGSPVTATFKP